MANKNVVGVNSDAMNTVVVTLIMKNSVVRETYLTNAVLIAEVLILCGVIYPMSVLLEQRNNTPETILRG